MQIVFSMEGIKNMDQLYTWTSEYLFDSVPGKTEHYHGKDYCEKVITALSGWKDKNYLGMQGRIANIECLGCVLLRTATRSILTCVRRLRCMSLNSSCLSH